MIFIETGLKGAYIIEPELHADERGFFARTWCEAEATAHGLNATVAPEALISLPDMAARNS